MPPTRKRQWIRQWKVPRSTDDGTWTVSQDADGSFGCSCPKWRFARKLKPDCHHIEAVKANPDAYAVPGNPGTPAIALPPILPGHVEAVTTSTDERGQPATLHPLIPLNGHGTDLLATVVFDLMALGYGFGAIKKQFHMIPREWTAKAVRAHVQRHGRCLQKTAAKWPYKAEYVHVAVGDEKTHSEDRSVPGNPGAGGRP